MFGIGWNKINVGSLYFDFEKYNAIKIDNYNTKEVSIIKI
jgi:hypothetical protein